MSSSVFSCLGFSRCFSFPVCSLPCYLALVHLFALVSPLGFSHLSSLVFLHTMCPVFSLCPGWIGDERAKTFKVFNKEFSQTVLWPLRPSWTWKHISVDKSNINRKSTTKCLKFYNYVDAMYSDFFYLLQIQTDW